MNVIATTQEAATALSFQQKSRDTTITTRNIHFYDQVPCYEMSIDEFEIYALKRLKVLKKIEQLQTLGSATVLTPEILSLHTDKINAVIKEVELDDEKIDVASHYILRLSYCRNEELRHWFCKYECELLRHRLKPKNFDMKSLQEYMGFVPISDDIKQQYYRELHTLAPAGGWIVSDYYQVPFTQVLSLVANRKCLLRNGYAYVHENEATDIVLQKFRTQLSQQLAIMGRYQYQNYTSDHSYSGFPNGDPESVRILPLIHNLDKVILQREPQHSDAEHQLVGYALTAANMSHYVDHMPLCMRNIHRGMLADGKLKYHARLQYSLFLKGAGLTMEDCIAFLQKHFRVITNEEFNKQYSYNLRHIYGKEGKRESKSSYACMKIIMGLPAPSGPQQHHGCPYRHYDSTHLYQLLSSLKIGNSPLERKEIVEIAKEQHQPQVACQKHFHIQHPLVSSSNINVDNVGNHPNAWFRASLEYHSTTSPPPSVTTPNIKQEDDGNISSSQPSNTTTAPMMISSSTTSTVSP